MNRKTRTPQTAGLQPSPLPNPEMTDQLQPGPSTRGLAWEEGFRAGVAYEEAHCYWSEYTWDNQPEPQPPTNPYQ